MICDSTVYDFCYSKHKHCHEVAPYLKDLVIQIDNQNYTIPPSGYLLDHMSGTRCGIAISSIDYNLYILGDTFMRNFYTSFDFSTLQVQLASTANPPSIKDGMDVYVIMGITFLSVSAVGVVAGVVVCIYKRKCCCSQPESSEQIVYQHSSNEQQTLLLTTQGQQIKQNDKVF